VQITKAHGQVEVEFPLFLTPTLDGVVSFISRPFCFLEKKHMIPLNMRLGCSQKLPGSFAEYPIYGAVSHTWRWKHNGPTKRREKTSSQIQ